MGYDGARATVETARRVARLSTTDWLTLPMTREVRVPARVHSHEEFASTILSLWKFMVDKERSEKEELRFLCMMYYLLGWIVGDAGKDMGSRRRVSVRLRIGLTKRHRENLELGNHIMKIVESLGVRWTRIPDTPPAERVPHGSYRWNTYFSPIFGWMYTAVLGLGWSERTTRVPVKMKWIFSARLRCVCGSSGE
jgi:hypothetical protein